MSRARLVSGVNTIAPAYVADEKASLDPPRSVQFSSVLAHNTTLHHTLQDNQPPGASPNICSTDCYATESFHNNFIGLRNFAGSKFGNSLYVCNPAAFGGTVGLLDLSALIACVFAVLPHPSPCVPVLSWLLAAFRDAVASLECGVHSLSRKALRKMCRVFPHVPLAEK